uniref:Telomeric repeat-binding factor 2-interacting protein 1 n=1 Tax=Phytophthora ramorum TaxID=164328 RepID=H3H3N9_PHYRM
MASLLFRELRFYLTRTLSVEAKAELKQLVEQNGGEVSATPAGAMQIVDCERLDARHPEWISTEFIKDSVASRALQDPAKYSGGIFTTEQSESGSKRRGRMKYTLEEDARMLHFAKRRDWKSMDSVPESAWRRAEEENVTLHPAQSMHEHFRKQLQRKTPMEQRIIMAKAAAMIRARLLELGEEEEEMEVEDPPARARATPPESTTLTQLSSSRRTASSATNHEPATREFSTVETRLKEVEEEKFVSATPATPATSEAPVTQSTPTASASPANSLTEGNRRTGKRHQNRKRRTPSSSASHSQEASPSHSEMEDSDAESVGSKSSVNGIFFCSVWAGLSRDPSKRRMLQRYFEPPSAAQARSSQSASSNPSGVEAPTGEGGGEDSGERRQSRIIQVEQATDEETEKLICQLQLKTQHDMPTVVHALYYCSGDVEMAEAFLKGASPAEMWSPGDDLLLVNLVAEEGTNRATVAVAVNRGDFAAMQVSRDTDAILKRVQFLR